jgi:hypothetical protein
VKYGGFGEMKYFCQIPVAHRRWVKLKLVHCYTTKGKRNEHTERIETYSGTETGADGTRATATCKVDAKVG